MPSSPPISAAVPPPRPMVGRDIPAPPASPTIPMSLARWPPTSCSLGFTGSSPISRSGPWASITGCAASTSNPTSMNSSSASTAGAPGMLPSDPYSASPPRSSPVPTRCWSHRKQRYKACTAIALPDIQPELKVELDASLEDGIVKLSKLKPKTIKSVDEILHHMRAVSQSTLIMFNWTHGLDGPPDPYGLAHAFYSTDGKSWFEYSQVR